MQQNYQTVVTHPMAETTKAISICVRPTAVSGVRVTLDIVLKRLDEDLDHFQVQQKL